MILLMVLKSTETQNCCSWWSVVKPRARLVVTMLCLLFDAQTAKAAIEAPPLPSLRAGLSALPAKNPGAPIESDVIFSVRFMTRRDEGLHMAKAYGATRIEWTYSQGDHQFAHDAHHLGARVGGTINANVATPGDAGVARDFDGNALIAPWMASWGAKWITTTNPEARKALFEWVDRYIAAGYDAIQVDDPILQASTKLWSAGDFSDATVAGFARYIQNRVPLADQRKLGIQNQGRGFDFRAYLHELGISSAAELSARESSLPIMSHWGRYLRETVVEFYVDLRRHLDRHPSGRHVALSMNAGEPRNELLFPIPYADYLMAEVPIESIGRMAIRVGVANAYGLGFVASAIPTRVAETRNALIGYYALGAQPLVPWDVFMGADTEGVKPRYFGEVDQYGDIFHFVRRHAQLFDGWIAPPVVGLVVDLDAKENSATMDLAERLVAARVPFCVLPIGSDMPPSQTMNGISELHAILAAQSFDDPKLMAALRALNIPQYFGADITEHQLRGLAPLKFGDQSTHAVIPHVRRAAESDGMVIHFVGKSLSGRQSTPLTLNRRDICEGSIDQSHLIGMNGERTAVPVSTQFDIVVIHVPPRQSEYSLLHIECN